MAMYAVWIAWGDKYIQEARQSANSLKSQMPDVMTCLFTTGNFKEGFDRVGTVSNRRGNEPWYTTLVRWCYESLQFLPEDEKCLYLDTDTRILAPVYDLYGLLDKYDIAGAHAPARFTQPLTPMPVQIPDSFPELNIGVLASKNNEVVKDLFSSWQFKQVSSKYGNNDQRSLRAALWESDAKLYVFTPEYNFRFGFGGFAGRPVKILHGRSGNMNKLIKEVGSNVVMKTWHRKELP